MHVVPRYLPVLAAALITYGAAQAQSFRTYLSSTGSDANPCTVAQPCRLLPAALGAVADGGEVWILDSANFNAGGVPIAKNVSISSVPGQLGSVVAVAGNPGIAITAPVKVTLRNLAITNNAANPGNTGVVVGPGATLLVDGCTVSNVPNAGIQADAGATLHVRNSTVRNNGFFGITVGDGSTLDVTRSVVVGHDGGGIVASSASNATTTVSVTDSTVSGNGPGISGSGIYGTTDAAQAKLNIYVTRSTVARNGIGLFSGNGANGGSAVMIVTNSVVTGNDAGYMTYGAGTFAIKTLGNNHFADNGAGIGTLTPFAAK